MNAPALNISTSNALASRAMLVTLKISLWSARRLDKEITDEINSSHGAEKDAGRYNKLLIDRKALQPIEKVVSETRNGFAERTLPWLDDGQRIMANDAFLAHTNWINGQKAKFDAEVRKFLADYPNHVSDARKRLNGMFREDDYPDVSIIEKRFNIEVRIMPVQTASEFRVAMSEGQAEMIRREIEANVQKATRDAVGDVYRRVAEVCQRMVDRLGAYKPATRKGEKTEGIFRDSLVENVRDLVSVLPSLNITGDPALTDLGDKLKSLAQWDAKVLRDSETKREDVKAQAEAILSNVAAYL